MKSLKISIVAFIAMGVFIFTGTAQAMPPKMDSGSSFKAMDKNDDGQISKAEFFEVYPSMKDAAFATIDTDNDEIISPDEWDVFFVSHKIDVAEHDKKASAVDNGQGDSAGNMGEKSPEKNEADSTPPLVVPGKK